MSQVVDIEAAKEFMQETLAKTDQEELVRITEDLESKSKFFRESLAEGKVLSLSDEDLDKVLSRIFSTRRRRKEILEKNGHEEFKKSLNDLLHGENEIHVRFQTFCDNLKEVDTPLKYDLTAELLHFTSPEKYWLWTRWMWEPEKKTGSLPLVTSEEFDLEAPTLGETYLKVGKGVAFVQSISDVANFQFLTRSLFGTDVFLGCVYTIYAYTVLRMRMTQEFNNVMPDQPEFVRRILGIYTAKKAVVNKND